MPANGVFSGAITNLLSILCVLMKILSNANAKKKTKRFKDIIFRTFIVSFSSDIMAAKGLRKETQK